MTGFVVLGILILGILGMLLSVMNVKRDNSEEGKVLDAQKAEYFKKMLESGERFAACSAMTRGKNALYCAATDRRLFVEDRKGLHSIPYSAITKIKLRDFGQNKTRSASKAFVAEIWADKKYAICNYSGNFERVVQCMLDNCGAELA